MLKHKSKKPSRNNGVDASANSIPDPWSIPNQGNKAREPKIIPEAWQLPIKMDPSLCPAGSLGAPSLASHQLTSEEILLEDELKLKTIARSLIEQLEKALALIYWVKTTKAIEL